MLEGFAIFHDTRFDHLTQQVVALTGTLTHTGEHGETTIALGDVVDELLDQYGFAHTGTTEETDLATLCIGLDQVDYLDTGEQYLGGSAQVFKQRRLGVDRAAVYLGYGGQAVDGITRYVEQAAVDRFARGHGDGFASINDLRAAHQAFRAIHGDATNAVFTQVLLHLHDEVGLAFTLDLNGVVNFRQLPFELHVHHSTDDLFDFTLVGHIKYLINTI